MIAMGLLLATNSQAQSRDNFTTALRVAGAVINPVKGKPLKDATVELRSGSKVIEKTTTGKAGSFEYKLAYDRTYTIYVIAEGYATQFSHISTKGLNEQDKYYDYEYAGLNCRVATQKEGVDYSMFEEPVTKLAFSSETGGFVKDEEHEEAVRKNRAELDKAIVGN